MSQVGRGAVPSSADDAELCAVYSPTPIPGALVNVQRDTAHPFTPLSQVNKFLGPN